MKPSSSLVGVVAFLFVCLVTAALPGRASTPVRADFIKHAATLIERSYLFPDKGKRVAEDLRRRQAAGEFDRIADPDAFAKAVTEALRQSSDDLHFSVRSVADDAAKDEVEAFLEARRAGEGALRSEFNGFKGVSNLGEGVGYLAFSVFRDRGLEDLDAALRLLRHADAIVLDLRGHRGGTEEMTNHLLSHFLPPHTHLSDTHDRNGFVSHEYTSSEPGSGARADVPLFVLVDQRTASGAEAAAFFLKNLKRATITGANTMGAAHSGGTWTIHGFSLFVPNERHVDPATGTTWEKVGVGPNVTLAADIALPRTIELAKAAASAYAGTRQRDQQALLAGFRQAASAMPVDAAESQWRRLQKGLAPLFATGLLDQSSTNDLGYLYLGRKHPAAALAIFSANVERSPDSANAHDSLAEAYEAAGRLTDARSHYARAVELARAAGTEAEPHRQGLARVEAKLAERR